MFATAAISALSSGILNKEYESLMTLPVAKKLSPLAVENFFVKIFLSKQTRIRIISNIDGNLILS